MMDKIDINNNNVSMEYTVYDYISLRNIVLYEKEGLKRLESEKAYDVYSKSRIRRLNRKGVIIIWIMGKYRRVRLSCVTRMILSGLIGDEDIEDLLRQGET